MLASRSEHDHGISGISLNRYFTATILSNGDVGASMSYFKAAPVTLAKIERHLMRCLRRCEHLSGWIHTGLPRDIESVVPLAGKEAFLLATALLASVGSALSARYIASGGDEWFRTTRSRPDLAAGAEVGLVVGFGGYVNDLAAEPGIRRLDVVDSTYRQRSAEIDRKMDRLRRETGVSVRCVSRLAGDAWRRYDVVSMTGSTLSNGSFDTVLDKLRPDARVILQGQTASVHPRWLFARGVDFVATTLKPTELYSIARRRRNGSKAYTNMMEGGLPYIFLLPRTPEENTSKQV